MFFKKRKLMQEKVATQERQIKSITGSNKKRIKKATEPIRKLTQEYENNGITYKIARAIVSEHHAR